MFRIDVLQDQWLWAALALGTVLVLATALAYLSWWRTSRPNRVPWVLSLTYLVVIVFVVAYALSKVANPPNW